MKKIVLTIMVIGSAFVFSSCGSGSSQPNVPESHPESSDSGVKAYK